MAICRICNGEAEPALTGSERMFGWGGEFAYVECRRCGCLQIADVPGDLGDFYPPGQYYSFAGRPDAGHGASGRSPRRRWVERRNQYLLFGRPAAYAPLAWLRPSEAVAHFRTYVREVPVRGLSCRVLDVGCGSGRLLDAMAALGFDRLRGIDPFLERDATTPLGVPLRRRSADDEAAEVGAVADGGGPYDLVVLDHVVEHSPDPVALLRSVRRLVGGRGVCRLETPAADCLARRQYGADWIELDAPRHLHLFTAASLEVAAGRAGLAVVRTEAAGTPFEFWGSELYRRGLTFHDPSTGRTRDPLTVFTPAEMARFDAESRAANRSGAGGRIVAHLKAAPGSEPQP